MAIDRAHQLRIVVQPESGATVASVRAVAHEVLGDGWQARRLTRGSQLVVLTGASSATVGTDQHARESHEAALALIRHGRFRRTEADVPVPAFEPPDAVGAFGSAQCGDDSARLDWVHRTIKWHEAMSHMAAATRGGVGIRIGHPDSGYTLHPNLGADALDLALDRDVIDNDDDALDDLDPNPLWPMPNPGHGTSTGSVIVGRGTEAAGIVGLAPAAKLVPIRATESVVQLFDSDVAEAVAHARRVGCHIVSMSLGGKGFFGLEEEIQRAVDVGMIVMAAAGNHVRLVTAPASFGNCLAVAATGPGDIRWDGSSRSAAVDVSMPGSCVHNASFNDANQPVVSRGNGTSYSVAHLAGAAALWLAHHGRDQLITRYGARNVQAAFLAVLRWPEVCVVPADWDDDWGIGRVDLLKLLQAPLPPANELDGVAAFGAARVDAVERIAAILGVEPVLVRTRLAALLGADTPQELATLLAEHEGELVYLAMVDDTVAGSLAEPGAVGAFAATPKLDGVSVELSSRLKR